MIAGLLLAHVSVTHLFLPFPVCPPICSTAASEEFVPCFLWKSTWLLLTKKKEKEKKTQNKQQQSTLPLGVGTRADTHPYLQYLTSWHGTWLVEAEFFIRAP